MQVWVVVAWTRGSRKRDGTLLKSVYFKDFADKLMDGLEVEDEKRRRESRRTRVWDGSPW